MIDREFWTKFGLITRIFRKSNVMALFGLFAWVILIHSVLGATFFSSSSFVQNPTYTSSFNTYYSTGFGTGGSYVSNLWPILDDPDQCRAQKDLLLQVPPGGCQPAVVRSDLLAEQNVPVFCQIDALKLNPLVDIKDINNIVFEGKYPPEIVSAGFHPARAALRTHDILLGDPLLNNIGYVVVILNKQEKESALPAFVNVTLTGRVRYESGNSLGIGRTEFYLVPTNDEDWNKNVRDRQSFWNGRFAVRAERIENDYVILSIYSGDKKVSTARVERGKLSPTLYVPGSYCRVGLQASYDGLEVADTLARLELSDEQGTDVIDVYENSKIFNERCEIDRIFVDSVSTGSGFVDIQCPGQTVRLSLRPRNNIITGKEIIPIDKVARIAQLQIENPTNIVEKGKAQLYSLAGAPESCEVQLTGSDIVLKDFTPGHYSIRRARQSEAWRLFYREKKNEEGKEIEDKVKDSQFLKTLKDELVARCEKRLPEKEYDAATDRAFNETITYYEKIALDYPAERSSVNASEVYGEQALHKAIALAKEFKKEETRARLMDLFVATYPKSTATPKYRLELENIYRADLSDASKTLYFDNRYRTVRLVDFRTPSVEESSVTLSVDGKRIKVGSNEPVSFDTTGGPAQFTVRIRNAEQVTLETTCPTPDTSAIKKNLDDRLAAKQISEEQYRQATSRLQIDKVYDIGKQLILPSQVLRIGNPEFVCGKEVLLQNINVGKFARIRLLPEVKNAETKTNVSVYIGIEKRAIQLSPNKTMDKITHLNQTIQKWERISTNLGNLVKGLKGACFATAGVLSVKSFLGGLDGTALAREHAMQGTATMPGWKERCKDAIATGVIDRGNGVRTGVPDYKGKSMTYCFDNEKLFINSEVEQRKISLEQVNAELKKIESQSGITSGSNLVAGRSVDTAAAMKSYLTELQGKCQRHELADEACATIQGLPLPDSEGNAPYKYADLRELHYQGLLQKQGVGSAAGELTDLGKRLESEKNLYETRVKSAQFAQKNYGMIVANTGRDHPREPARGTIKSLTTSNGKVRLGDKDIALSNGVALPADATDAMFVDGVRTVDRGIAGKTVDAQRYAAVGKRLNNRLVPSAVYRVNSDAGNNINTLEEATEYKGTDGLLKFQTDYNIASFENVDVFGNQIRQDDLKVRYFETGPDKGFAHIVPFDVRDGWYVRVDSQLRLGSQLAAYDASGVPRRWKICNVGVNGGIDERDECDEIVDGISSNRPVFSLPQSQSEDLIRRSRDAIMQANRQQGSSRVTIFGQSMQQGPPASPTEGIQCQEFMSPTDCKILFNFCDPVICPATRCNLGGTYQVADVIQSGIVGSTLLCLPNIREGVYIPVCLTGIHAGIDAYLSILKSSRDCLQESVSTGKMIGICDQITSVYLCEFFWRQVAPVTKVILPKIVESLYSGRQGARGGGEYLTVMHAWTNMERSVNYFKNTYAVNAFEAFKVRSIEEAGTPFCKAFVSAKAPTRFESLIEPDSPPQFHAWFSAVPFTTVTVPATAQYKVFYHIFAGKDAGIYYKVYLKNPPTSAYYAASPLVLVRSGFIGRGEYKTETRDFTAPEGYRELCIEINGKEECGFGQVSTSFAVNYARDIYARQELNRSDITTSAACVSGSPSALSLLANTNPGAALQEGLAPSIYQRGIVRVCASRNPAGTTDPTRYIEVGYCDGQNLKCWLDTKSVDDAITDSNIGFRNATVQELQNRPLNSLQAQGSILREEDATERIKFYASTIDSMSLLYQGKDDIAGVQTAASQINEQMNLDFGSNLDRLYLNPQKAQVYLLSARVREVVARVALTKWIKDNPLTAAVILGPAPVAGAMGTGAPPAATGTGTPIGTSSSFDPRATFHLRPRTGESEKLLFFYDVEKNAFTDVYLSENRATARLSKKFKLSLQQFDLGIDQEIASVVNNEIRMKNGSTALLNDNRLHKLLTGAQIKESNVYAVGITPSPTASPATSTSPAATGAGTSSSEYSLEKEYNLKDRIPILKEGNPTDLYVQGTSVYHKNDTTIPIGKIENDGTIKFTTTRVPTTGESLDKYRLTDKLDGAKISDKEIIIPSPSSGGTPSAVEQESTGQQPSASGKTGTSAALSEADFVLVPDETNERYYVYDLSTKEVTNVYLDIATKTLYKENNYRNVVTRILYFQTLDDPIGRLKGTLDSGNIIIEPSYNKPGQLSDRLRKLNEAESRYDHVYIKGKLPPTTAPVIPKENSDYSLIVDSEYLYLYDEVQKTLTSIFISSNKIFYDRTWPIPNTDLGNIEGNIIEGKVILKEINAISELGFDLYKKLHNAPIINLRVYTAAEAYENPPDFKLTGSGESKYLYDVSAQKTTRYYLKNNIISYSITTAGSSEVSGTVTNEFAIAAVENNHIVLYPDVQRELGDDIYARLHNALVKGNDIFSSEEPITASSSSEKFKIRSFNSRQHFFDIESNEYTPYYLYSGEVRDSSAQDEVVGTVENNLIRLYVSQQNMPARIYKSLQRATIREQSVYAPQSEAPPAEIYTLGNFFRLQGYTLPTGFPYIVRSVLYKGERTGFAITSPNQFVYYVTSTKLYKVGLVYHDGGIFMLDDIRDTLCTQARLNDFDCTAALKFFDDLQGAQIDGTNVILKSEQVVSPSIPDAASSSSAGTTAVNTLGYALSTPFNPSSQQINSIFLNGERTGLAIRKDTNGDLRLYHIKNLEEPVGRVLPTTSAALSYKLFFSTSRIPGQTERFDQYSQQLHNAIIKVKSTTFLLPEGSEPAPLPIVDSIE